MQPNLSKLKYRIVYCSGEEQDYPVTELLTQTPQAKGWQSPKYCEFPMEIAIQFVSAVRVRQVQFLSHHCKISTKIELYVYMPDKNIPANHREIKYKKLGYLSLDSNERGGFQARELKSVYIDTPALYMKFLFQKCHVNKFNLFNQIGLIALSVFGEPLDAPPGYAQLKPKEFYNEIQYETQFDQFTLDRLRGLEDAKEKAVAREDFLEAKRIKEAIERLKQIGVQLRTLEERKAQAIHNEDYDSAAIIKQEIEKLRNAVAPESLLRRPDLEYAPPIAQAPPSYQQPYQQPAYQQPPPYTPPQRQDPNEFFNQPQQAAPMGEMMSHSQFEEQKYDPKDMKNRRVVRELQQNHDEQVIPTMKNKNPQVNEPQEQEKQYNVEPLSGENLQKAQPLIPILTDEFCKLMFSKSWNAREDALKWLETQINRPNGVDVSDLALFFVSAMAAINYKIGDKVAAVSQRSVSVLQALLAKHSKLKVNRKAEFNEHIDQVIQGVMEKSGDNNQRLKEQGDAAMLQLAEHPSIGPAIVVQHLVKGFTTKPKLETSIKHIVGRLYLLTELIKAYQINNPQMPYQPIIDYAIKQLDDKNENVRTQAICVLVEAYRSQGARLRQSLSGVRQAQMQVLEEFFSEIDGGGTDQQQSAYQEPKTIVSTNIEVQGAKGGTNKQKQGVPPKAPQQQQQQQQQHTAKCDFCDLVDPAFRDTDKLDQHLWGQCPMLINCQQCQQVIEIAELTHHLLAECDHRRKFKQCPKCKEAHLTQAYDKHVEECRGRNDPQTIRCPLCHTDLKANANTWKMHLVNQGCLNNESNSQYYNKELQDELFIQIMSIIYRIRSMNQILMRGNISLEQRKQQLMTSLYQPDTSQMEQDIIQLTEDLHKSKFENNRLCDLVLKHEDEIETIKNHYYQLQEQRQLEKQHVEMQMRESELKKRELLDQYEQALKHIEHLESTVIHHENLLKDFEHIQMAKDNEIDSLQTQINELRLHEDHSHDSLEHSTSQFTDKERKYLKKQIQEKIKHLTDQSCQLNQMSDVQKKQHANILSLTDQNRKLSEQMKNLQIENERLKKLLAETENQKTQDPEPVVDHLASLMSPVNQRYSNFSTHKDFDTPLNRVCSSKFLAKPQSSNSLQSNYTTQSKKKIMGQFNRLTSLAVGQMSTMLDYQSLSNGSKMASALQNAKIDLTQLVAQKKGPTVDDFKDNN